MKKRRRKYQRKQDLAHIKAQWALFQQISADTKDLVHLPRCAQRPVALGLRRKRSASASDVETVHRLEEDEFFEDTMCPGFRT